MSARWLVAFVALSACVADAEGAFTDHDEPSDYEPVDGAGKADGPAATFDRHLVVSDALVLDTTSIDGDDVQAFFETSPYGTRSWLADLTVTGGRRFADALVEVATVRGFNPLLLLVRMQVEKSLVSKTERPGNADAVDFAFGCGCPDGRACNEAFRGLDRQLTCSADTFVRHWNGSVEGTGAWRMGQARRTLDPISVTPKGHGTASLYAYTPWVLQGSGGNWLVWNVARRYHTAFADAGALPP